LRVWIKIGTQSFGGGSATLTLIRRAAVEEGAWISEAEFSRIWGMCQIAPGINLFNLTVLIGKRVGGALGVVLALAGLVLPSAAITIAITALYSRLRESHLLLSALRGYIPASVGLGILMIYKMLLPLLKESRKESLPSLAVSLFLFGASGFLLALYKLPVMMVLLGVGGMGACFSYAQARRKKGTA
jgi:chromate transporter